MRVSELITQLKVGELKKLSLKSSDSDVLGFINSGVAEIYKRFPLWRDSVAITPVLGVTDYYFNGDDLNVPVNLDDAVLMLIEEVTATDTNKVVTKYVPNNTPKPSSFSCPRYDLLRINSLYDTQILDVQIRLAPTDTINLNYDVPLPPQMLELLRMFVAFKAFSSVNAGVKEENNAYFIRFESAVTKIEQSGLYNPDSMDASLLSPRGFK